MVDSNSKELILIVDDQANNLKVISSVLSTDYSLTFAKNGATALQLLTKIKPDLILLDIMMPDMDGFEVCKKIKQIEIIKDIPIIFLSAKSEMDDLVKGFDLGAVDYITKPFEVKEVQIRIKNHLNLANAKKTIIKQKKLLQDFNTQLLEVQSELAQSNQELKKTNFEKNKYFSILAQNLKSPFNGFLGLTKMMAEEIENISLVELKSFSMNMYESAYNLYQLLENLLEWSKMKSDNFDYNPESCLLSFLITQIKDNFSDSAKQKEITIVNDVNDKTFIYADIPMINLVLKNLIYNAIKFSRRGGVVEIGVSEIQNMNKYEIFVKDNGIGISKDMIDKLFKIDGEVSRLGTENELSTGLGLLLCREFVEQHGGNIWVESEIDKGSTFYFTMPKVKE